MSVLANIFFIHSLFRVVQSALLLLLFDFTLQYVIRKVEENKWHLTFNSTQLCLVCDYVNFSKRENEYYEEEEC